jgi:hypothetical protein
MALTMRTVALGVGWTYRRRVVSTLLCPSVAARMAMFSGQIASRLSLANWWRRL